MFDRFDFQRIATGIVGAVIFSTACIGFAVAPARALEKAPAVQAQAVQSGANLHA